MAKKYKFSQYVSPVGIAKLTFLDKPSKPFTEGGTEYYKTRILLEDDQKTRDWINKIIETAQKEAKEAGVKLKKNFHVPFVFPEDVDEDDFIPDEGKERPKYDEEHREKIFFEAKSQYKPGLIDTAKQSLPEDVRIMGGDDIRLKFIAAPYVSGANTGITLRLRTVQLVNKNTSFSGSGEPDTDGFDDIDGYVAPDVDDDDGDEDF